MPDDADDLRGFYLRLLLGKASTRVAIVLLALVAGIAGTALASVGVGLVAAGGGLLAGLAIAFAIADSRSEDAFFNVYAQLRGLTVAGKGPLPRTTPLLRKGDDRYAERSLRGPLAVDVEGVLALYTYEEESHDSDGNRQTEYHRYTVGLAQVPECAALVPELICQRQFGLRALEGLEDAFRSRERVKLESSALDEHYEIFVAAGQDQIWLRRLFSPTFIVWLGEEAPEKFAFELIGGHLCCYVKGHKKSAQELDTVRAASAAVARRLREEAGETRVLS